MSEVQIGKAYAKNEIDALALAKDYYRYGKVTRVTLDNDPLIWEYDHEKHEWRSYYYNVFGNI
jgi:hypothetical protein